MAIAQIPFSVRAIETCTTNLMGTKAESAVIRVSSIDLMLNV